MFSIKGLKKVSVEYGMFDYFNQTVPFNAQLIYVQLRCCLYRSVSPVGLRPTLSHKKALQRMKNRAAKEHLGTEVRGIYKSISQ